MAARILHPIIGLGALSLLVLLVAWSSGGMNGVAATSRTLGYALALLISSGIAVWVLRALWRIAFHGRHWAQDLGKAPLTAWFGLTVIVVFVLMGFLAPLVAPFGETQVVAGAYLPQDSTYLFGTDQVGRDIWSRILFGARNTIGIALVTTVLAFLLGSITGMLAATMGRVIDQVMSRIVDVLMSIPQLIFALLALSIFGTGVYQMVLVIAVLDSTRVFRLARAVTLGIVAMDFIEAAKLRGEGLMYLMRREILPNAMAPLVAEFGLRFCYVLLTIAALSFLGLGIQPPTADWASMVAENKQLITFGIITPLIPGAFIALLTVSMNLVVDWKLHQASGLKD